MSDKEFRILESTLCADIAETESQVSKTPNYFVEFTIAVLGLL